MPTPSPRIICAAAGAIADSFATNERLLEIIVELFQRGEFNRIRLANKAIAKFEADDPGLTPSASERISWKPPSTAS